MDYNKTYQFQCLLCGSESKRVTHRSDAGGSFQYHLPAYRDDEIWFCSVRCLHDYAEHESECLGRDITRITDAMRLPENKRNHQRLQNRKRSLQKAQETLDSIWMKLDHVVFLERMNETKPTNGQLL